MRFKRYDDIENSYRTELIEQIKELKYLGEWVAEEKIHGANFSFWITESDLKVAKRSGFLDEKELHSFYRCGKVVEKYRGSCHQLFQIVNVWVQNQGHGPLKQVVIYGELFGGWYPHPEVPRVKDVVAIQKEIAYNPDLDYLVFDLYVKIQENQGFFVDVWTRNQLLGRAGFFVPVPLMKGTLEECLAHPNMFPTTIPKRLGFPEIEDNICEGIVIRPVVDLRFSNHRRVMLKTKNEKFAERRPGRKVDLKKVDLLSSFSAQLRELLEYLLQYHVKTRFTSIKSKLGPFDETTSVNKLVGLYIRDLLLDFERDRGDVLKSLTKRERKRLLRALTEQVKEDVTTWLAKEH